MASDNATNLVNSYTKIRSDVFLHCTLGGFAGLPDKIMSDKYLTPSEIRIIQKEVKRLTDNSKKRLPKGTWALIASKLNKSNPQFLSNLYSQYKNKWKFDLT